VRALVIIAAIVALVALSHTTNGVTKAERISRIRGYVKEQKQDLADARSRLGWTWNELQTAQEQITHIGWERDWYREHYEQDEVELAKYRKHGIFGGILSVVGLVFSFVTNPFAFIVSRALQVVFGLGLALIIFAVALFLFRRYRRRRTQAK
jgi:hypothetical protein